jgi:eukaryotic-like serine/threonine-protein kinase
MNHATPRSPTMTAGAVFGRYVLVEPIGRGAMGEVWAAIDPDLDRKIALKLLRRDRSDRPRDRARLDAEARAMARLTHPNVVTIHDVGRLGEQVFIAMEFVAGESLDHWIARGPHPWEEVLAIMRQAGAGLAAAHDVGLVHRDFKPANVMIGDDARVRVLDFGLARPEAGVERVDTGASDDGGDRSPAKRLLIQGSPAYMSPEQQRGAAVDARGDLFSFCVVLFEALHGVRPFQGGNRFALALAIVEGRMIELSEEQRARAPEWVRAIVVRGLAVDAQRRWSDMHALLAALERSPERVRRRRLAMVGAIAGVAGLITGTLLLPGPAEDPCAAAVRAPIDEWDADARLRLRHRIEAVTAEGSLAGQRVVEGIDRQLAAAAKAGEQLCRDRRAQRSTERLHATRSACLDDHRAAVQALVKLARDDGDPAVLEGLANRPFAAVRALGDPARCVDRPAPLDDRPMLSEAARSARAELALLLELLAAEPAPERLARALADADPDHDLELALLLGRLAAKRGERAEAEAHLQQVAARAGHAEQELAARA